MRATRKRLAGALVAALAFGIAAAGSWHPAGAAPQPSETLAPFNTPPPLSATATPRPAGELIRFATQLLDVRAGYVFFTTGDAFRLDPHVAIVDAATNGPPRVALATRTYARAVFDVNTGNVIALGLSRTPLPQEALYEQIKRFAVALSTPFPNPELRHTEGLTGAPVLIVFTVEVPAKTPFGSEVFLATDASGWSATAIKMDRIDALHYRVTRTFPSGAKLLYRYTRGSWQSSERGQDGLQEKPRQLTVPNLDVRAVSDVVYHWGDENLFQPDLGQSVPTPFNPNPYITPPHGPNQPGQINPPPPGPN
jgi:hypothetical protein